MAMLPRPEHRCTRRGSALVEAALILTILLTLIFGMIDLGLGVMRFNMISHAAREGARQAMVNGQYSLYPWPPGTWNASTPGQRVVDAISPQLVGCDLTQTTINVAWVDGTNEIQQRVRVTIDTTYQPLMTYLFGAGPLHLEAASTTRFAH
jgi:Flp pilus assembly protein TadG